MSFDVSEKKITNQMDADLFCGRRNRKPIYVAFLALVHFLLVKIHELNVYRIGEWKKIFL